MKIINIDADEKLCLEVLNYFDFIDNILAPQRNKLMEINRINLLNYNHNGNDGQLPKVRMFEVFDYANVANLIHTIPIYLTTTKSESIRRDKLGAYVTSKSNPEPRIELYINTICNECRNKYGIVDFDKFKYLFVLTLLHELGHAALDVNNCSWYATPFDDRFTYSSEVEYDGFNGIDYEEGMANAIAYRIIKECGNESFAGYARSFIEKKQLKGYNKGCEFEKEIEKKLNDFTHWKMEKIIDNRKSC